MRREFQVRVAEAATDGLPVAQMAKAAGVARSTVYEWQRRYRKEVLRHFVPDLGYLTDHQFSAIRCHLDEFSDPEPVQHSAYWYQSPEAMHRRRLDRITGDREQLDTVEHNLEVEVVLAAADGLPPALLAEAAGIDRSTVYDWKRRYSGKTLLSVFPEVAYITDNQITKMCSWIDEADLTLALHSLGEEYFADLDPRLSRRAVVQLHYFSYKPKRRRML